MQRLGALLARLQRQWALGFSILLVLAVSAAAFALAAGLILWGLFALLGWAGLEVWFAASALLWLPLSVGAVASFLRDVTKPRVPESAILPRSPYA